MKAPKSAVDYLNDGPSRSVPLSRSVPAYLQIEEQLADRIEAGEFAPGDVLPTERELTRQLGVSRMTVRAAMDRLVQRDLIVRRQGSGTFVADPKLRQDASKLRGFFEDTVGQGVTPDQPPARTGRDARDSPPRGGPRRVGRRIRVPDRPHPQRPGMPVVLETSYFPAAVVPGLLGWISSDPRSTA